jgi:hypothetical protein
MSAKILYIAKVIQVHAIHALVPEINCFKILIARNKNLAGKNKECLHFPFSNSIRVDAIGELILGNMKAT